MRKYRFAQTNSTLGKLRPYLNTLYFVAAWNIFGYAIWKYLGSKATNKIEGFEEMSGNEKAMYMFGPQPTTKITVKGFKVEKIEPIERKKPKQSSEPIEPIVKNEETS